MILKRYGNSYQSVQPNLNSRALTEIGFIRDGVFSIPVEEFHATYEKLVEKAFSPETDGEVHDEAESELLQALKDGVMEAVAALGDGEVLLLENQDKEDRPKTKDIKKHVVVDGEHRFHFHWRVEPPLRLGVYQAKA